MASPISDLRHVTWAEPPVTSTKSAPPSIPPSQEIPTQEASPNSSQEGGTPTQDRAAQVMQKAIERLNDSFPVIGDRFFPPNFDGASASSGMRQSPSSDGASAPPAKVLRQISVDKLLSPLMIPAATSK